MDMQDTRAKIIDAQIEQLRTIAHLYGKMVNDLQRGHSLEGVTPAEAIRRGDQLMQTAFEELRLACSTPYADEFLYLQLKAARKEQD